MHVWDWFRAICSDRGFDGLAWRSNTYQQVKDYSQSAGPEGRVFYGLQSVQASDRSRLYILQSLREHFPGCRECLPGNSEPRHIWGLFLKRFRSRTERDHLRPIDEKQPPGWYKQLHGRDLLRQLWIIHLWLLDAFRLSRTPVPAKNAHVRLFALRA